jgi:PAS domain S-box-containing protein
VVEKSQIKELEKRVAELELEAEKSARTNEDLQEVNGLLLSIVDNTNLPIFLKDSEYRYKFINPQYETLAHRTSEEVKGKTDFDIFPEQIASLFRSQDEEVMKRKATVEFKETILLPGGEHTFITSKFPLMDSRGNIYAVGGVCMDITQLQQTEDKLERERKRLNEVNIAIKVLLKESSQSRDELEENMRLNAKNLLLPYLAELESDLSSEDRKMFVDIIKANIAEITSSFSKTLANINSELTPREIQIADFIRQGRSNKEIAKLLNITPSAVDFHRRNLRKKFNIKGEKTNLRSHLLMLEG